MGNLHERSLREIWNGNEKLEEIRRLTTDVKTVVGAMGPAGRFLNFCPGIAEAVTGSPLEVTPEVSSRAELFHALATTESQEEVLLPIYQEAMGPEGH